MFQGEPATGQSPCYGGGDTGMKITGVSVCVCLSLSLSIFSPPRSPSIHPSVAPDSCGEELARCQEEARRLQGALADARDACVGVSEERLQLQQENLRLRRETDEQRKASLLVQKRAKQQVRRRGMEG